MPKNTTSFVCQNCGEGFPKWSGKCPDCGEWNTLVETVVSTASSKFKVQSSKLRAKNERPVRLSEVQLSTTGRLKTGIAEFDRVLGGGFVPGQVVLLAGEPGIGKSTLLLQVAEKVGSSVFGDRFSDSGLSVVSFSDKEPVKPKTGELKTENRQPKTDNRVLYVAGEESPEQLKIRAARLVTSSNNIEVLTETDVDSLISYLSNLGNLSNLIIIDSIQTLSTTDLASAPGSVAQVRECAYRLTHAAKNNNLPLILVGHINKEGEIAGPKVLEHLVDTVLYLEGERAGSFRLLKAVKNRFGDPSEVGVFKMEENGFAEVFDPASTLLEAGSGRRAGSVVCAALEGNRPLMLEVQALTSKSVFNYPRRAATGYDLNRVYFILAVLEKIARISLLNQDVYVNVAGGVPAESPAADLAIALAVVSSVKNAPLPEKTVVFGEVGLSGEVRHVSQEVRREKEAKRLGYKNVVGPGQVRSVREAIKVFNF